MLRERESGTFRTIFRLMIHDRNLESEEYIFLPLQERILLWRDCSPFSTLALQARIYVTCFALSYCIFTMMNFFRKEMIGNVNEE